MHRSVILTVFIVGSLVVVLVAMGNVCMGASGASVPQPLDPEEAERRRQERLAATEARLGSQAKRGAPNAKTPSTASKTSSSGSSNGRTKEDVIADSWRTGS